MTRLFNKRTNELLLGNLDTASSFDQRLIGLMFRRSLEKDTGLLITSCKSIHTCFMRFPIDVLFLDEDYKVVKYYQSMRPWRMTRMLFRASMALEANGDQFNGKVQDGDQLEVRDV